TGTLGLIGLVLLILVIWGLVALFSGGGSAPAEPLTATAPVRPGEPTIDIVTTGPVPLEAPRPSDGTGPFHSNGALPAGFRLALPRTSVLVKTSAIERLQFDDQDGRAQIPGRTGPQNITIPLDQVR